MKAGRRPVCGLHCENLITPALIPAMKPSLDTALHLLHGSSSGALATHSTQMPGYPFASALPFVPDEGHRPVFLLSALAEHTKNLVADSCASLLVTSMDEPSVLTGPRMTIVGDVVRFDAAQELAARFVRYQPDAEQYLALGDFAFFRLIPKRARYIGGFAQMGWIEEPEWSDAAILPLADEAALVARFESVVLPQARLLGIDCYGIDVERDGKRQRLKFSAPCNTAEEVAGRVSQALAVLR